MNKHKNLNLKNHTLVKNRIFEKEHHIRNTSRENKTLKYRIGIHLRTYSFNR